MLSSSPFVHLDIRSCFSLKEGAFTPEQLAARAAELGMPAVAMTDRDGLYGAARFVDACQKVGVRPILGASLTVRGWEVGALRSGGDRRAGRGPDRASWGGDRRAGRGPNRASSRRPDGEFREGAPAIDRVDRAARGGTPTSARLSQVPTATTPDEPHMVILATDDRGYANLCRLITDAHMLGERLDPSVAPLQLCAHAPGLIALLGPRSAPGRLARAGRIDAAAELLAPFREAFGERVFVAVEHRMERRSGDEIRAMLRLAERAEVRAVATNPVRFLVPEDAFIADALECMREIVPVATNHVSRENAEGYLKPAEAMRLLFAERPDLCDATLEIAERCAFDIGLKRIHFPDFPTPAGRSADALLAERCWRGVHDRGQTESPELRERLRHELALIRRMGYAAYFLTVAEIVSDVKAMGIRCACRGSAAGSLVCYLTGISDVDALRHGLAFERFLNPMRDELPDIDVDVESARREDVYDMVLSRHGDERAACVAMIDTYRARSAIREVGKALGLPDVEMGVIAKAFPHISARHLREGMERLPELRGIDLPMRQLELLFRVAERLDGFPRHIALHPCGIVLSSHDLVERVPLERSANGHRMIQADKDDVELLGYLKLDVLGVRMLSSMRHALDEIARTTGEKVDLDRIAIDDPPTFELIRASDTLGCFQIESPGQRELLQKLQPERWEDLIVDISLFRPGPVKSDMITPYLRRRAGMERPTYIHPGLRPALRETFGVIVYHEQVMRTLEAIAGFDLTYADHVRRHLDHEELLPGFREDFLRRASARGVDGDAAVKTWEAVAQFASFGFCKAHAAAFAVPTYQSAWLKAHYMPHFLAGVLTHDPGMYPRRLILEDARLHEIPILPLDVNLSEPEYVVEEVAIGAEVESGSPESGSSRYGIRLALQDVHGISDAEIRSIQQARADRPFRGVDDFLRRTKVSRPVAEALAHAGAFDAMSNANRRAHLYAAMTSEPPREANQLTLTLDSPDTRSSMDGRAELGVRGFRRAGRGPDRASSRRPDGKSREGAPAIERVDRAARAGTPTSARQTQAEFEARATQAGFEFKDYTDAEVVRAELEVLGLDATRHIVSFYEPLLADLGVVRARDLHRHRGREKVMVAGVKVASQTPAIRSGQRIIFLSLDDATGPIEVTVFESVQPKVARTVFHAYAMAAWGELRRTGYRGVSVVAEDVWDLTALHRARARGELREALGAHPEPTRPARRLWHASGGSAG